MTRHVTIPSDVAFSVGQEPWTFWRTLVHVLETDPRFNTSGPAIRASVRIDTAFRGSVAGAVVQLGEEDWKLAHAVFEAPACGWCPPLELNGKPLTVPGKIFLPYIDALSDEATREPKATEAK